MGTENHRPNAAVRRALTVKPKSVEGYAAIVQVIQHSEQVTVSNAREVYLGIGHEELTMVVCQNCCRPRRSSRVPDIIVDGEGRDGNGHCSFFLFLSLSFHVVCSQLRQGPLCIHYAAHRVLQQVIRAEAIFRTIFREVSLLQNRENIVK